MTDPLRQLDITLVSAGMGYDSVANPLAPAFGGPCDD
jgi:hypothetical protein